MSSSLQAYHPSGAVEEKAESHFTSRIRNLGSQSEDTAHRLDRVLNNLRGVPPPAAVAGMPASNRQSCIEDYLGHTESTNKMIDDMLTEIERLIG